MKKIILILTLISLLTSCADEIKRQKYLQTLYPNCKVEPATGIIKTAGYQFIVIDATTQIIAVSFYTNSETRISSLRNIR